MVSLNISDDGYTTPFALSGLDPSKDNNKVYEIDISSETNLRKMLGPQDATVQASKDLAAVMLDVVALPGTFARTSGSNGYEDDYAMSDLQLVGGALQELVDGNSLSRKGRRQAHQGGPQLELLSAHHTCQDQDRGGSPHPGE
jgi:selenophosphate synthase